MSSYLPKDTSAGSTYSEGGGLYALGLIHANHGGKIMEYLLGQLKDATTEVGDNSYDALLYEIVCFDIILVGMLQMGVQDVTFLPSRDGFSTTFLRYCGRGNKTVVGLGKGMLPAYYFCSKISSPLFAMKC